MINAASIDDTSIASLREAAWKFAIQHGPWAVLAMLFMLP